MATEQITDDELLALRVLANARGGVKLGSSVLLRLLNTVAALRAQLAERCVVGPDEVTVPREEWEVLNTISAFWCPPFGVPQNTATEALFAKLDALRSGEASAQRGEV